MYYIRVCLAALIAVFIFNSSLIAQESYSGDTFAEAQEAGVAEVTITYVETPAFVYRADNGDLVGICVDIIESFSNFVRNKYGISMTFNYKGEGNNFQTFYKSVQQSKGGVFGLGNVTVKESRKSEVAFTPPYIKNIALLVTQSSVQDVENYDQIDEIMNGFTAYVPPGTTHEDRMKRIKENYYPRLKISYTESSKEALDRVLENPRSVCFQDIALYWDYKRNNQDIKYHPLQSQESEDLAMIMPKGSDWQPVFEEFFQVGGGFKSSSIYRNSLVRHLGEEVVSMLKMAQ